MVERQRVDQSATTALATCSCGWRSLQGCRSSAWQAAHTHAMTSHPGDNTNHVFVQFKRHTR